MLSRLWFIIVLFSSLFGHKALSQDLDSINKWVIEKEDFDLHVIDSILFQYPELNESDIGNFYLDLCRGFQKKRPYKALFATEKAIQYYSLCDSCIDNHIIALYNSIILYEKIKNFTKVVEKSKEAISLNPERPPLYKFYRKLGRAYSTLAEFDKSEQFLLKSEQLCPEKDEGELMAIYNNLGSLYRKMETVVSFERSLYFFDKALEIARSIRSNKQIDQILNDQAIVYYRQNQFEKALEIYLELLDRSKEVFPVITYNNILLNNFKLGNIPEAEKYFRIISEHPDFIKTSNSVRAEVYNNYAEILRIKNDHRGAIIHFHKCCELTADSITISLGKLHNIEQIKNKNKYLKYAIDKTRAMDEALEHDHDTIFLQSSLKNHLYIIDSLIDILSNGYTTRKSRVDLRKRAEQNYDRAIRFSFAINDTESMYYFMEKSKSFLLFMDLQDDDARGFVPDSLRKKLEELESRIYYFTNNPESDITGELTDLILEKDALIALLESNYPQYLNVKRQTSISSVRKLLKRLNNKDVYISYYEEPDHIYALVLSKNKSHVYRLASRAETTKKIQDVMHCMHALNNEDKQLTLPSYLHVLYETLLAPFDIEDYTGLHISPDGVLNLIPLGILMKEATNLSDQESYIGYHHPILYQYSASLWNKMSESNSKAGNKVLCFSPSFDKKSSTSNRSSANHPGILLYNKAEARTIHEIMGGTWLNGADANRQNLIHADPNHAIIHLATHSIVNLNHADSSYILLSDEYGDFDSVFLGELFLQQLPVKMVVLSSCNSGVGPELKGEGVMSLAKAFAHAGAQSLVSSYWQVSDKQTRDLMELFYRQLDDGKPKHIALYEARKEFMNDNIGPLLHPFYWGSFVVFGDDSSISSGLDSWKLILAVTIAVVFFFFMRKRLMRRRSNQVIS